MNRNVESHFAMLPKANIQRSIFDRSSSHKTSFNAGRLIPFYIDEVLPGDTFDITTSKVVRSQTMLTPIMDDLYLDTYWFFVPNRLVWEHWEEFCGENKKGPWAQTVDYRIPTLSSPAGSDHQAGSGKFSPGTLADYFGLPIQCSWQSADKRAPISLPFRAYALICNHFFRDQNLSSPLLVPLGDANQTGSNGDGLEDVANGGLPYRVAKYHDYFTSALPAPQKGDPVSVPLDLDYISLPVMATTKVLPPRSDTAKASADGSQYKLDYSNLKPLDLLVSNDDPSSYHEGQPASLTGVDAIPSSGNRGDLNNPYSGRPVAATFANNRVSTPGGADLGVAASGIGSVHFAGSKAPFNAGHISPLNLAASNKIDGKSLDGYYVDSAGYKHDEYARAVFDGGIQINNLRLAVALQSFLEALARGGSRYGEMIATIFGVQNPDARLQHPEYLGGNRCPLNINQVTNTAQQDNDPLGDVGAQSVTSDVHSDFIKSFTEHGYLIGVCCVRYDHTYSQGLERFWSRREFTDFYNPKFANLGEVPIYTSELWNASEKPAGDNRISIGLCSDVFGYQEIWSDYRYKPNRVSSEMRPSHPQTLAHWHLADNYAKQPHLSDEWIREDPANVDRVLAVTSTVSNQFWADFYVKCRATRCMPMYSIPALEPRL